MPSTDLPPVVYPPAPKPRRSTMFWVMVLVPLCLLAGVLLLVGGGALFYFTAEEEPISDSERQVIIDADTLSECMDGFVPDPVHESISLGELH